MTDPTTDPTLDSTSQPESNQLAAQIAALSDEHALTVLNLVLKRRGQVLDAFGYKDDQAHIEEALRQPEIVDEIPPDPSANAGDLARTALTYLADTSPATKGDITHALTLAPRVEKDPVLLFAVGALVVMAFHADINLEKDPDKGWKFHFRTKPLKDSTIGKMLGQLLGNFINTAS